MSTIDAIYVFENGTVMVFDERGQQMPDYQGTWAERAEAIIRDKPADVVIATPRWVRPT